MRRIPPAILLSFGIWGVFALVRVVLVLFEAFELIPYELFDATRFVSLLLLIVGMLELRQRGAALAFGLSFVTHALSFALITEPDLLLRVHEVRKYTDIIVPFIAIGSLAVAVWYKRPGLALCAIASTVLVVPPMQHLILRTVAHTPAQYAILMIVLSVPRLVLIGLIAMELARPAEPRPIVAADGLRHAARALCVFSAVAAIGGVRVVPLTAYVALAGCTLLWCAFGLLRAATLPIERWFISAAGAAVLWCSCRQLSSLQLLRYEQRILDRSAVIPVLLIAAAVLVSLAVRHLVDKTQLQAKGVGAVLMFVTALSIALFLVPQSQSMRSLHALDALSGFVIALGAWMLSWLCRLAADQLVRTDELPVARVL